MSLVYSYILHLSVISKCCVCVCVCMCARVRACVCACTCVCMCMRAQSCLTLQPARLLCPQKFSGKNTGVGCHFLLHIFPYLRIELTSLVFLHRQVDSWVKKNTFVDLAYLKDIHITCLQFWLPLSIGSIQFSSHNFWPHMITVFFFLTDIQMKGTNNLQNIMLKLGRKPSKMTCNDPSPWYSYP